MFKRTSAIIDHPPTAIAFYNQTSFIGDKSGNLSIFHLDSGIHSPLSKQSAPILAIGFGEDSLYSFNDKGEIQSWDLNTLKFKNSNLLPIMDVEECYFSTRPPKAHLYIAQFDHRGRYLFIGRERQSFSWPNSDLLQVDLQNYESIKKYHFDSRDLVNMDKMVISRDGTQICASGLDVYITDCGDWGEYSPEFIAQWNLEDGNLVAKYECGVAFSPHDHHVFVQAFSPDGKQLLVSLNGELSLWDVSQGMNSEPNEHLGHFEITEMDWSPVSDLVAFGKPDGTVSFFDMSSTETIFEEQLFKCPVSGIHFSADGRYLAAFSSENHVEIFQML